MIRIVERKSKDKIIKKETKENKKDNYQEKNSKNNLINNINKNSQIQPNNIKTIKNIINENKNSNINTQIKKKKTFLGNMGNTFKIGIKGVFMRSKSGKKKE